MKKLVVIVIIALVGILLVACVPTEPKDMLPYCQGQYELLLKDYPDMPHAFVGYCVAGMQTDKYVAYSPMCDYEPVWQAIEDTFDVVVTSRSECIEFFRTLNEERP